MSQSFSFLLLTVLAQQRETHHVGGFCLLPGLFRVNLIPDFIRVLFHNNLASLQLFLIILSCVKVGSHDLILVQLSFTTLCMMENVGVHAIQFSHPIYIPDVSQRNTTILVLRICAHFTSARSSSGENISDNRAWEN